MSLAGTFDTFEVGELLELLAAKQATGRLEVWSLEAAAVIWYVDGLVVGVDPVRVRWAGARPSSAGHEHEDVEGRWLAEVVAELLFVRHGRFEFEEGHVTPVVRVRPTAVSGLLVEARRDALALSELQRWLSSPEARPRMAPTLPAGGAVRVNEREWRLLALADGRRSVATLARLLDLPLRTAAEEVVALIRRGLLVTGEVPEGLAAEAAQAALGFGSTGALEAGSSGASKPAGDHGAPSGAAQGIAGEPGSRDGARVERLGEHAGAVEARGAEAEPRAVAPAESDAGTDGRQPADEEPREAVPSSPEVA
jgi:hypothetical protein